MKQLKSSREYWKSVTTNWQKRYICKWKGREGESLPIYSDFGQIHISLKLLIEQTSKYALPHILSLNLWLKPHLCTERHRIGNLLPGKLLFFVLMFISFLSLIADIFFGTLEFPFLQFQIVTVAPIWIRGTLDRGQRITIAHWGEEGAKWWSYKKCRNTVGKCESMREKKTFSLSLGLRFC